MNDYKIHPLADLNPMMEGDAYERLVEDIKAHGQREPIVMYQGEVLDGRNSDESLSRCRNHTQIP